jgi:hypothetical protein
MEAAASRVDRQREEEIAAEDELMFKKYAEGKVSGQEIIAYIQKRVQETGYDKAQQDKWKAALIEYRNNVADETATAEYEKTGDINKFINHWKTRIGATKKGTPERTQIQQLLSQLREERDHDKLKSGADRIMREITKGKKSTTDLIAYYREALKTGKFDSDTKSQIRDTIANLQKQHRQEQYQVANLKIDEELARGGISPAEAAKRKQKNANQYGLQTTDPVAYAQLQGEMRVLNATPDPVEVQKWQNDLESEKITPLQFAAQMEKWADQIARYDQRAAWELRGQAQKVVSQYEAAESLPGGGIIGHGDNDGDSYGGPAQAVGKFVANRVKIAHVSQLDGGTYSQINCTMASAAMMGHTMGVEGLTGSDLRAQTGDTEGGTTLLQAKGALEKNGVYGLRYKDNYDYNKFVTNIKQGATAMVSGYLGNMAGSGLNNAGASYNHNVYVTKYHPKKGFLVLDPAKRNDKGTWISEKQMRAFAWTGSIGSASRNGSVMFSPKGTLTTQWNKGKSYDPRKNKAYSQRVSRTQMQNEKTKSGAMFGGYVDEGVAFIGVDEPAATPQGEQYEGQFAKGTSIADIAAATAAVEESWATPEHKERLANAGITYGDAGLDTRSEVEAAVNERTAAVANSKQWIDAFESAYRGGDGAVRVTVGSQVRFLTLEDVSDLERELVESLDGLAMLNTALGNNEGTAFARETISEVIKQSQNLTMTDMAWEENALVRNGMHRLEEADGIEGTRAALEEMAEDLNDFVSGYGEQQPGYDPTTGTVTDEDRMVETEQDVMVNAVGDNPLAGRAEALGQLIEQMNDPTTDPDVVNMMVIEFAEAFEEELPKGWPDRMPEGEQMPSGLGAALTQMADNFNTVHQLDLEQGEMVYVEGGQIFVPYESAVQVTASGERAVQPDTESTAGELGIPEEEIDPETGMRIGGASEQVLDLDYLTEQGYEIPPEFTLTGMGLPKAFIMVDGQPTAVSVIPTQQSMGPSMLRVNDVEKVLAVLGKDKLEGLEENGMLSSDLLESFTPAQIAALVQGGENAGLIKEPVMAWTMRLPGQQHSWFQDPQTQQWHYNGLPHIGTGGATIPGAPEDAEVNYIGSKYGKNGAPTPDSEGWDTTANASTGVTTPYFGVEAEHAQILQSTGEGNIDSGVRRDPDEGETLQATEEQINEQYSNVMNAGQVALDFAENLRKEAAEKWEQVQNLGPEARAEGTTGYVPPTETGGLMGAGSLPGLGSLPDLSVVGATDTSQKPDTFQPGPASNNIFNKDYWTNKFDSWKTDAIPGATSNIPKLEWKPTGTPNQIKSEEGYVNVDPVNSSESYTPPKPESSVSRPDGSYNRGR